MLFGERCSSVFCCSRRALGYTAAVLSARAVTVVGVSGSLWISGPSWVTLTPWKIYLCLAIPAVILLNLAFPNFHAPDDYDHVKRAYTLLHQPFQRVTLPGRSTGAMIDSGLTDYIDALVPVVKRPKGQKAPRAYRDAVRIGWTNKETFSEAPGSLSYFPLLYAPQAAMLEIGRLSGASVAQSVLWARFANGFAGIGLIALGLYWLQGLPALVLLLTLLPQTLLQFASNSADPILYGAALVIVALSVKADSAARVRSSLLAAAIFISASVRPPMAALALAPAVQAIRERRWLGLGVLIGACIIAALWVIAVVPSTVDLRCGVTGPIGPKLRDFALAWPMLIGRTLSARAAYFFGSFVGDYGWGDGPGGHMAAPLPAWIYGSTLLLLCLALWRDLVTRARLSPVLRLSLAVSAICSILLIFLAMAIGCTVPNQAIIAGVQGRYFVPPLFALAPAIRGLAAGRSSVHPTFYIGILTIWVVACVVTMLLAAPHLYVRP